MSGTFQTAERSNVFCSIREYISIAHKNKCRVFDVIHDALRKYSFIPLIGYIELT